MTGPGPGQPPGLSLQAVLPHLQPAEMLYMLLWLADFAPAETGMALRTMKQAQADGAARFLPAPEGEDQTCRLSTARRAGRPW